MGEPGNLQADGVELRPCKACGCPLAFVTGPNGKKLPLDLRSTTYVIKKDMTGHAVAQASPEAWVSHFKTCPKAGDFSASKKR